VVEGTKLFDHVRKSIGVVCGHKGSTIFKDTKKG